jgi:hypothetical protein
MSPNESICLEIKRIFLGRGVGSCLGLLGTDFVPLNIVV